MRSPTSFPAAVLLAAASLLAFVHLINNSDLTTHSSAGKRLLAATRDVEWDAKTISAIVLSVLVSLTSSIDRECGVSLYMVLFAVLLNLPFRTAIAMTAITVTCGSLGPGIAAMSEPHVTERGVRALVDYPGALVLLPTMFYGMSWGIIVNHWFPNWLLALLWVVIMAISNIELIYSYIKIIQIKKQAVLTLRQLGQLNNQAAVECSGGKSTDVRPSVSGIELSAAHVNRSDTNPISGLQGGSQQDIVANINSTGSAGTALAQNSAQLNSGSKDITVTAAADSGADRQDLHSKLLALQQQAEHIESIALLYPAFHTPTSEDIKSSLASDAHSATDSIVADNVQGATPSMALLIAQDEMELSKVLNQQFWAGTRFTFRWKDWWKLQNGFEFALLFKIVVVHLVFDAIRHHSATPCSMRYWIMLGGMTGAVTLFLVFVTTSYSRHRLWRGPHWRDALEVMRKKARMLQDHSSTGAEASTGSSSPPADLTVIPGAANSSEAIAAGMQSSKGTEVEIAPTQERRCCSTFGKRLPWRWVPASEAFSNISACNSRDQYTSWTKTRLLASSTVTLFIGGLGCSLGLPGGPMMAYLLLGLGLKPHAVAGTSRFLVLCFCFGCSVAYAIVGSYHKRLAVAFALLNLGMAPLGMLLFNRLRLQSQHLLLLSLVMGLVGMSAVLVYQLVPLMADVAGSGHMWLDYMVQHGAVKNSVAGTGNDFDISRFCSAH